MRIDANHIPPQERWFVWHCEEMRQVRHCIWVDDATNEYCTLLFPFVVVDGTPLTARHQANRVQIVEEKFLVLINPIENAEDDDPQIEVTVADGEVIFITSPWSPISATLQSFLLTSSHAWADHPRLLALPVRASFFVRQMVVT